MKDYYKILGLEAGASLGEITARWLEFKKQYQFTAEKHNLTERIKEINEAYRILKASVPPADEFDVGKYLKKGVLARKAEGNAAKKKMVIMSSSIFAICLISGAFLFTLTRSPKTVELPSTTQADPYRITRGSIEKTAALPQSASKPPVMIAKTAPQEPSKTPISKGAPSIPISKDSPTAFTNGTREAKGKEKPATAPALKPAPSVEVARAAPQEPSKTTISKGAPPIPISKESPTAIVHGAREAKVKDKPAIAPALKPAPSLEAAREVPRKPSKTAIFEGASPLSISKESPATFIYGAGEEKGSEKPAKPPALKPAPSLEAAREVPREPSKTPISEGAPPGPKSKESPSVSIQPPTTPALKPAPSVKEAKVIPQEESNTKIPGSAKNASIPSPPPAIASEREVLQFFESYAKRYNSKWLEGFIAFFSHNAIENQKDNFEKMRKTYDNFFRQMETVQYQIAINKIEPQQNSVEVKAHYLIEGTVSKGGKKQSWKGQVRWILVRENGALRIISIDYQPQK